MHIHRAPLLGAALALFSAAAPLGAQAIPAAAGWHLGAGVGYESYTFADADEVGIESLSLLSTPFAARARFFGRSSLTLSGGYATGTMTAADGTDTTVEGLTDTQVQLDVPVGRELLVLSAIVALPTGQATQSMAQATAAGVFAADLLPFRVSSWGTGGAVGLATSLVRSAGDYAFGLSVGYSVAGEFEPLEEDERAYRPGNELRVRAAADRTIGRSGKASLQLTANLYDDDQLDGQNLYRSGNRYSAVGSYAFAAGGSASGILYGGVLHRSEGTYLELSDEAPSQDLILAGGGLRLPLGGVRLLPSVDGRVFRSADGLGQGYATGVGASLEVPTGAMTIVPSLRGRFGTVLVREGAESGFTGLDAGLTVRFGGRR